MKYQALAIRLRGRNFRTAITVVVWLVGINFINKHHYTRNSQIMFDNEIKMITKMMMMMIIMI